MTMTIVILVVVLLLIVLILNALFLYLQKRNSNAMGSDAPHVTRDPGIDEATAAYLKLPREEWTITSNSNKLYGWFVPTVKPSNTTVLIVHGFAVDHSSLDIHAQLFNKLGYNVLQIDNQAAGKSEGKYQGFGYLESIDTKAWIDELLKKRPDEKVVIFGASMGAATVMMTAGTKLPDNVKAVIEDSGYTSMEEVVNYHFKDRYHISGRWLLRMISIVSKVRAGFFYGQADCTKALQNCHLPILFMHGKQDTAVPYFMRDELLEFGDFPKETYSLDKGVHIRSYYVDSVNYQATVDKFLKKYL
ncbi:alpha/beta hydrolase [Companilactobacillus ginsenosidimutans]|uniref:Alpha/beta hydrolase n=1 Tax=Companilactobacillus ginsenosidimutans TaxID=1007676 RepID=A0A0H4QLQ8_9LACO|nr:alpha/beta fold hydrolase [Companilactobacillus ginsenosidimutans]AKP67628.1 alpha/beta hydrolase [Companilactobacillus ginsenosidimutans]